MARLWAVSMMRDEEDIAYNVVAHLVGEGCAGIIVADNNSVDGTRDELLRAQRDFASETVILVKDDAEVGYYQSDKMTSLAAEAGENGAEWVLPFDADELWYSTGDRIAKELNDVDADVWIVEVAIFNHFGSKLDPIDDNPFTRIVHRQAEAQHLPKVLCRWSPRLVIEQGNHSAYYQNRTMPDRVGGHWFRLRHFPYRSFEQMTRKALNGAEAYKATTLPYDVGRHWREYGQLIELYGPEALREVFDKWFFFPVPSLAGLVYDPAPWCRFGT